MGFSYQAWTGFSEASVWSFYDGCKVAELPNQFSDWASSSIRSRISTPNWSRPKSCLYCTMPWDQNLQQHHFTTAKPENLGCFLWGPDSGRLSRGTHSLVVVWLRFDVESSIRSRALIQCKQACFWREILPLFLCRIMPFWRKSWLLMMEFDTYMHLNTWYKWGQIINNTLSKLCSKSNLNKKCRRHDCFACLHVHKLPECRSQKTLATYRHNGFNNAEISSHSFRGRAL